MYQIVLSKAFNARQGLKSPVRAAKGLPGLVPDGGFSVRLSVAIRFNDTQINEQGWFVDTDAVEDTVASWAEHLSSDKWIPGGVPGILWCGLLQTQPTVQNCKFSV
jgi:hypothetical protein